MKWILFFLLLFASMLAFELWYLKDTGNITITWLGYEIQFSVVFGFILIFVLMFVMYCLFYLIRGIRSIVFYGLSFFQKQTRKTETSETLF